MAINLAGPGRKETKDFFTREGGICLIVQVVCMAYCLLCYHYVFYVQMSLISSDDENSISHFFIDCLVLNQLDT